VPSDPDEVDTGEVRRATVAALTGERLERERLLLEEARSELAELTAWMKTPPEEPPPRVLRPLPFIIVAGGIALLLWFRHIAGPPGTAIGAMVITAGMAMALQDILSGLHRFRRTPVHAVRWFADMLKERRVDQAMLAVATSSRAAKRRSQMAVVWGKGPVRVFSYRIEGITELAPGFVMARLQMSFYPGDGDYVDGYAMAQFGEKTGTEGFGSLENSDFVMERLLIRRGGRWYLANGLPDSGQILLAAFASIPQEPPPPVVTVDGKPTWRAGVPLAGSCQRTPFRRCGRVDA
jgi:hypothetical protein